MLLVLLVMALRTPRGKYGRTGDLRQEERISTV